jgi:hypothetical protein
LTNNTKASIISLIAIKNRKKSDKKETDVFNCHGDDPFYITKYHTVDENEGKRNDYTTIDYIRERVRLEKGKLNVKKMKRQKKS